METAHRLKLRWKIRRDPPAPRQGRNAIRGRGRPKPDGPGPGDGDRPRRFSAGFTRP